MGKNDETGEDDKDVDNEVEKCVWVPGKLCQSQATKELGQPWQP